MTTRVIYHSKLIYKNCILRSATPLIVNWPHMFTYSRADILACFGRIYLHCFDETLEFYALIFTWFRLMNTLFFSEYIRFKKLIETRTLLWIWFEQEMNRDSGSFIHTAHDELVTLQDCDLSEPSCSIYMFRSSLVTTQHIAWFCAFVLLQ